MVAVCECNGSERKKDLLKHFWRLFFAVSEKFKRRTGDILNCVLHESCPRNCDLPPGLLQACDEVSCAITLSG